MVISTAIDKYIYITVNRKFDRAIRASYSTTEIVDTVDQIRHELIRETLKLLGIEGGIEITSISDIPSQGTGLGSSSTYTVGLLNALYAYSGCHVDAARLAREACQIEIEHCHKPIGKQDQYIAAFGGLQCIQFNSDGSVYVDPIICRPETKQKLEDSLLLLYTGQTRAANDILSEQTSNTVADPTVMVRVRKLTSLARAMKGALQEDRLYGIGELMHDAWLTKKELASGISNERIDSWYDRARAHGAVGGKLLGAGGGGFLLLFCPSAQRGDVIRALPELRPVAFRFEPQGTKIVYVEDQSRPSPPASGREARASTESGQRR
jgi:D-glycero-alpha-D-manno-heptose-7-phosphate kinase